MDQRMSATGFEETDLTYQVSESESMGDTKVRIRHCLVMKEGLLFIDGLSYVLKRGITLPLLRL